MSQQEVPNDSEYVLVPKSKLDEWERRLEALQRAIEGRSSSSAAGFAGG